MNGAAALPPLAPGAVPAAVREAGPAAVDSFRAALGFERVLLAELLREALPEPAGGGAALMATAPETLADAIAAAGGTGIAAELSRSPLERP